MRKYYCLFWGLTLLVYSGISLPLYAKNHKDERQISEHYFNRPPEYLWQFFYIPFKYWINTEQNKVNKPHRTVLI